MLQLVNWRLDLYAYVKFIIGGCISLILNLIVTWLLTEFIGLWHMISFGIALGTEVVFLFIYHTLITFKKKGKLARFVIVILIISGLNWLAVGLLSVILGLPYLIAIVISAGVISVANYIINKKLVFKV